MKYELECETLTPDEVAHQLLDCGYLNGGRKTEITAVRLECGCDLEIDYRDIETGDAETETYTESDINNCFEACSFYKWAQNENAEDVLLCLN